MREKKFRAWFPKTKELVYFGRPDICYEYGTISFYPDKEEYKDICNLPNDYDEVDMEKLMQFTGLKDKNGKEIYEGDIVKESGAVWEVSYLDGAFRLDKRIWLSVAHETCEIIGNIYENPDLLSPNKNKE